MERVATRFPAVSLTEGYDVRFLGDAYSTSLCSVSHSYFLGNFLRKLKRWVWWRAVCSSTTLLLQAIIVLKKLYLFIFSVKVRLHLLISITMPYYSVNVVGKFTE